MTAVKRFRVHVAPAPGALDPAVVVVARGEPAGGDGNAWTVDGSAVRARLEPRGSARAIFDGPAGRSQILLPGEMHDILHRLASGGETTFELVVDGWRLEITLADAARAALRERATRGRAGPGSSRPVEVRAIIPGRVASVLVHDGETVSAGQALLVVEAMKMQNELRAPRAGTAARVSVVPGQTVEAGALLVVIE
jgi:acetyl/propionyl-CoA carboxylase alpha subunit